MCIEILDLGSRGYCLISCNRAADLEVTAQLNCAFVFAYAKNSNAAPKT